MNLKWIAQLKHPRAHHWVGRRGHYHNMYPKDAKRQSYVYIWVFEAWAQIDYANRGGFE